MSEEQGVPTASEGMSGVPNLAVPGVSQVPLSLQSQALGPVLASLRDVLDVAVSQSLPALVQSAVQEASLSAHKEKKRPRSPSPDTPASSISDLSSLPSPRKRSCKRKHLQRHSKRKQAKAHRKKRNAKRHRVSSSSSSASSSASSDSEVDNPSASEAEDSNRKGSRLFPSDLLDPVVEYSAQCLHLRRTSQEDSDLSEQDRAEAFPKPDAHQTIIPFPKAFQAVFAQEWQTHSKGTGSRLADKLYRLPDKQMALLKVPTVDQAVASLSSSSVPVDGDVWPKDHTDRRVEQSLRKTFEQSSYAFRACSANSVMARAAFIWAQEAAKNKHLPKAFRGTLKRIALASAFAADAALDAMRFTARAMGSNVASRRALWLRPWSGESASHSKLINLPFEGAKLFGKALEPVLVEGKDKRKFLPTGRKDSTKPKQSSFRPFRPRFKDPSGSQFRSRWTNASVLPRSRPSNSTSSFNSGNNRSRFPRKGHKSSKSA